MEIQKQVFSKTLETHFKFPDFRKGQLEVIEAILSKKDVLAVMPTSAGKSLCYQFPSVYLKKLVIVISPLISLMNDQVRSLKEMGIKSGCLHSGLTLNEQKNVFKELNESIGYLLYLSPERAYNDGFTRWIKEKDIALFAIDEAHCVSQWGHDFRPEYSKLRFLKEIRPDVPVMALTASATPFVLNDISNCLGLKTPERIVKGFYRPNLYYQVVDCSGEDHKLKYIRSGIEAHPEGRIIIYCSKRADTEKLGETLSRYYEGVGIYHAGLSTLERTQTQKSYSEGTLRILCATNAFGMGIDQSDVRLVVHYSFPKNIESLYQEMGRAGRDGKESTCLVLYDTADKGLQVFFIKKSEAKEEIKKAQWRNLDHLIAYCETDECRHGEILTYFKDPQRMKKCGHCDSCDPQSKRKVRVTKVLVMPTVTVPSKKKVRKEKSTALTGLQEFAFAELRTWRKEKADSLDLPAFCIFSNQTLMDVARKNPKTKSELLNIKGIGPTKVEQFGEELLFVLKHAR